MGLQTQVLASDEEEVLCIQAALHLMQVVIEGAGIFCIVGGCKGFKLLIRLEEGGAVAGLEEMLCHGQEQRVEIAAGHGRLRL